MENDFTGFKYDTSKTWPESEHLSYDIGNVFNLRCLCFLSFDNTNVSEGILTYNIVSLQKQTPLKKNPSKLLGGASSQLMSVTFYK